MIPKRGAIAGVLTAAGLALLLSFKTPQISNLTLNQPGNVQPGNVGPTSNNGSNGGNGANGGAPNGGANGGAPNGGSANGGAPNGGANGGSNGSTGGSRATYSGTLTGQAVQIPFGTVQVQVVYQNGKIVDVQALQMPSGDRHTNEVTAYAAPQLRTQVLSAQSAQIDGVSGATYTSYGYQQSLQSALDQLPA